MLNNVEREVIEPAKAPDTSAQQQDCPELWVLKNQDSGRHKPCNQEQKALGQDHSTAFQVSKHGNAIRKGHLTEANWTGTTSSGSL